MVNLQVDVQENSKGVCLSGVGTQNIGHQGDALRYEVSRYHDTLIETLDPPLSAVCLPILNDMETGHCGEHLIR